MPVSPSRTQVPSAIRPGGAERRRRLNILGVRIDDTPLAELVTHCAHMLACPPAAGAAGACTRSRR